MDALNGDDNNNGGLPGTAYKTITKALQATAGNQHVVINVIARFYPGTSVPVRHNAALGESFPLPVPRGTTIQKDQNNSDPGAPAIIDGGGTSPLVDLALGAIGSVGNQVGLKGLHLYDSANPAVYIRAPGSPVISGVKFNRCNTSIRAWSGLTVTGTLTPLILASSFLNSADGYGGPSQPLPAITAHIDVYAKDGNNSSPQITNCTLVGEEVNTTVSAAIRIRTQPGGQASPVIDGCQIGSQAVYPGQNAYGIQSGVLCRIEGGGVSNFILRNSVVNGCKSNGVEMISHGSGEALQASSPQVYNCIITRNGYRVYPGRYDWQNRVGQVVRAGHGVLAYAHEFGNLEPTIRNNGEISFNRVEGVNCTAKGDAGGVGGIENTVVESTIYANTIRSNGRGGVVNMSWLGQAVTSVGRNRVYGNAKIGVLNHAYGEDYAGESNETGQAIANLSNNVIFSGQYGLNTQNRGVYNERYASAAPGEYPSYAVLHEVHDTVASHPTMGIRNIDTTLAYPSNPGTAVHNTISYYNGPIGGRTDVYGFLLPPAPLAQVLYSDFFHLTPPCDPP